MSDEKPDMTHRRNGLGLTDRQAKWGAGIGLSLALVSQLKGYFVSREEGEVAKVNVANITAQISSLQESQKSAVIDLKAEQAAQVAELTRVIERKTDKIVELINKSEERSVRLNERQDNRIDNLEFVLLTKPSKTK